MSWEFAQVCICGRSFLDIAAFTRHNRNCQRGKKRLSGALTRVKEIYQNKRPQRLVGEEGTHSAFREDGTALIEDPTNGYPGPSQPRESGQSQVNGFGLFRVYDKDSVPLFDPEDPSSEDPPLQTPLRHGEEDNPSNPFHPYPNESSLLLGDWYWNHGSQKSRSSFRKLVAIVGNAEFRPDDIRFTNWTGLDRHLGVLSVSGNPPQSDAEEEYLDHDTGWMRGHAVISVPFSR
ncbi:hypothetical protein PISMIDRAFT_124131 [Pisolithus microcarpus 441]|uniref:Uncharacterized protein n=1 Tax=Pisolithus microcarpus 441 TaxID=765257 RepID=A0A0C9Y0B4_9AGAM|nr:hypothetical protein PISMIDRAFT_124131 [Pisolithus microcarpus 441]